MEKLKFQDVVNKLPREMRIQLAKILMPYSKSQREGVSENKKERFVNEKSVTAFCFTLLGKRGNTVIEPKSFSIEPKEFEIVKIKPKNLVEIQQRHIKIYEEEELPMYGGRFKYIGSYRNKRKFRRIIPKKNTINDFPEIKAINKHLELVKV